MNDCLEVRGFYWLIEYLKKEYPKRTFHSYFNFNEGTLDGRDVGFIRSLIGDNKTYCLKFLRYWLSTPNGIDFGSYYRLVSPFLDVKERSFLQDRLPYYKQFFFSDAEYAPYRPLIVLVGGSGVGKTTVAAKLEDDYGLKVLCSYTTRPPRRNDTSHEFLLPDEFNEIPKSQIAASTYYNGHHYCSTFQQIENADVCVLDENGIRSLYDNYKGNRYLFVVRITADAETCFKRMKERGDNVKSIIERIEADKQRERDWYVEYQVSNNDGCLDKAVKEIFGMYDVKYYEEH